LIWYDAENRVGEFEPVGTVADFQGKGLGKAVVLDGLRRLKARGAQQAIVYADMRYAPAQRLYTSAGFYCANQIFTYVKWLPDNG
jgi:ribosomal protein S18 acetylase RimI-like enzyme